MNEAVSNELSKSKQSVLNAYASEGKYIAPRAPYGYRKDPDDCHRLIIDPGAAANVKMIFGMAQHGTALTEIVRNLNQSGIMPPSLYARQNGLQGNYQDSATGWNTRTLKKMLTNCTYMGKLIQGKDHIAVSGTHEPIISETVFERVQQILSAHHTISRPDEPVENLLKGKVICRKCGTKMQHKRGTGHADWYFYTCVTKNRRGADACSGEYIREDVILSAVRKKLLEMQPDFIEKKRRCEKQKAELETQLGQLHGKQRDAIAKRRAEYERFIAGTYTRQEYHEAVSVFPLFETQINEITFNLDSITSRLSCWQALLDAEKSQVGFERVLRSQVRQVVVSNGEVFDIAFCNLASLVNGV